MFKNAFNRDAGYRHLNPWCHRQSGTSDNPKIRYTLIFAIRQHYQQNIQFMDDFMRHTTKQYIIISRGAGSLKVV